LSYTEENSHNLTAKIISKEALFKLEKIPSRKRARCHVIKEKEKKHFFLVFSPPPPPLPYGAWN
jgi:hypothetical protein